MSLVIPLQPIPNQTLTTTLGGQSSTINVYQQAYGLYMDLLVGTVPIVQGILGLNYNLIVRNTYFGYVGDFCFFDSQGTNDPVYTGLGTRYFLMYLLASELAASNLPTGVA